ncbi:MAG: hypothetical protein EP297_12255 [Gammaproteobacteria bacterium]|nr:MAG: hypothetical protein EP297_12255 [Gammaproteobacteria bacterium]
MLVLAILLGLAPLEPEPHLVEKLRMLFQGTLSRPIDIFDLFLHSSGIILLALKLIRMATVGKDEQKQAGDQE